MKDAFLSTVRQGNIEAVKALIKNNAESFYLSYYIDNSLAVVSSIDRELSQEQLTQRIKALEASIFGPSKTIVYTTWAYLDQSKLTLETMNSALIIAAETGNAPMLELLLSSGFDRAPVILLKGNNKNTRSDPIFIKNFQAAAYQFNYTKPNPNTSNEKGETVLQLAVGAQSEACVKLLLQCGSQITKNDNKTFDFCKNLLSKMLKSCTKQKKINLKRNYQQTFPDLFPTPRWLILLLYVRRILSNYIYNPLVAPLGKSLGYTLNSLIHALRPHPSTPRITGTPPSSAKPPKTVNALIVNINAPRVTASPAVVEKSVIPRPLSLAKARSQ